MADCDVLIVGGGPAGSSCAWRLQQQGLHAVVVDRATFPRDKPCAGWVTPEVFEMLRLNPAEYADGRTLQPIRRFITGTIGGRPLETVYDRTVSWGIRRCEFDSFLLRRAGCRVLDRTPVVTLDQAAEGWTLNGVLSAPIVVGAGGHFCPVARHLAPAPGIVEVVATQEAEILLDADDEPRCRVQPGCPELYFCRDMRGYGWCFRKGAYLNVGLGRMDPRGLPRRVEDFFEWLRRERNIPDAVAGGLRGHAYLLRGRSPRPLFADRALLVGDAAGLASSLSGEGIRPAVLSGILAAEVILECDGNYSANRLESYAALLGGRIPAPNSGGISRVFPAWLLAAAARHALSSRWLVRRVFLDGWFLGRAR